MPMPMSPSLGMGMQQSGPQQGPPPGPSPSNALLGPTGSAPAPVGPSPEQQSEALMSEVRDLTMRMTSLARQFPDGADDLEVAIQSLINFMTKTVIASSNTEPSSAPNLVG